MVTIKIDETGDGTWWLYGQSDNWKDYVCENFNDHVIIVGNRDFNTVEEAEWYERVKDLMMDIDNDFEAEEICDDYNLSQEQYMSLKEIYDKARTLEDTYVDALRVLYPDDTFESGTIRGYVQREWQEYIVKGNVDTDLLEAYYFGQLADITVIDGDEIYGDVITHDELWKAERGDLKKFLRERYDISEDEELTVMKADGYKQVVNWVVM